ncbi:MAG TPA: dienelactone hydrolase family protein, partial [Usitatibacter sp.]|nr:dienelactone hydrolase family protein [Usitatibacter sp.]
MGASALRAAALAALLAAAACAAPDASPVAAVAAGSSPVAATSIPIQVERPEGTGPFPAIVILHDCSGLGPRSSHSPARWAKRLLHAGYVVLMPDSFSTRGFPDGVCTDPSPARQNVSAYRRARDAYEALAYARALPYVDGTRVGVMGGSHGGSSTLATI